MLLKLIPHLDLMIDVFLLIFCCSGNFMADLCAWSVWNSGKNLAESTSFSMTEAERTGAGF